MGDAPQFEAVPTLDPAAAPKLDAVFHQLDAAPGYFSTAQVRPSGIDPALSWAIIGGLLWAVGPMVKRHGVNGASAEIKAARSAWVMLIYLCGALLPPAFDLLRIGIEPFQDVFSDPDWWTRLPVVVMCGSCVGFGGLTSTYAFAVATSGNTALMSLVQNGVFTVMGGVYVAAVYMEQPSPTRILSATLIVTGVMLAEGQKMSCGRSVPSFSLSKPSFSLAGKGSNPMFISVLAGCLWAFGPLGKRCGVQGAVDENKAALSTVTAFAMTLMSVVACIVTLLRTTSVGCAKALGPDRCFRSFLMLAGGAVAGLGGMMCTYAFTLSQKNASAAIATVENGIYTVFGALFISLAFRERLTAYQLGSACLVAIGIILMAA